MKGFIKGFFIGAFIILLTNFIWGYGSKLTYDSAKEYINSKFDSVAVDTISEEEVNIAIAKALQNEYGADSLLITSISAPSKTIEYYISGVRGTKECVGNQRIKKVSFNKGSQQYRVVVEYNCSDVNMIQWTNDESPITTVETVKVPELKPVPTTPTQTQSEQHKDSVSANNVNIGTPSNGGADYNNNSDV